MAWTKTKTTILTCAVALAVASSAIVGYELRQAQIKSDLTTPGLSPTMMDQSYTIGPDGSVGVWAKIQEINHTSQVIRTDHIGDGDLSFKLTDDSGHPMKCRKQPGRGILVTLNKAVPPEHEISYTLKASLGNVIKPNKSGDYIFESTQCQGNEQAMHLVEMWRLPTGATLTTNFPVEFEPSTNEAGQIELRFDKVLAPMERTELVLGYRLTTTEN